MTAASPCQGCANGYVARGQGEGLLLSSGFAASEDRAVYRFAARGDSIAVRDTLRGYAVDSVKLTMTLLVRDTLVDGLKVYLYRLPSSVDSTDDVRWRRVAVCRQQLHRQYRRA